jgi:glutaminase
MNPVILSRTAVLLLAYVLATGAGAAEKLEKSDIQPALDAAYSKYKTLQEGNNADYIPALAAVDSNIYGIGHG